MIKLLHTNIKEEFLSIIENVSNEIMIISPFIGFQTAKLISLIANTGNVFDDGIEPEKIALDAPARNINGRIMVPVRFLAENIGAKVTWNQDTQRINIRTSD